MRKWVVFLALLTLGASLLAAECSTGSTFTEQRVRSVNTRAETFARAENLHPVPMTNNFPMRQALVDFTLRTDLLNHPWFVYVLGDNGNILGYYVARTKPVNSCNFLSSTESIGGDSNGYVVLTAPSLDGIYYGGGGAAAGCDAWFFFESASNAMIEVRGLKYFVSDQPLAVEAEPILVKQGGQ